MRPRRSTIVYLILTVILGLVSGCGSAATSTPAPTLTPIPATGTAVPDARVFEVIDSQSIINYEAELAVGGLKMGGTFAIRGKTITLVPEGDGLRVKIDIQIDGNSVTGANGLVVAALKNNLETTKFPYGHFLATSKDVIKPSDAPVQTSAVGTVELHGETRPIDMPITVKLSGGQLTASAATTLDLFDFKVNVPTAVMKNKVTFAAQLVAQEKPSGS